MTRRMRLYGSDKPDMRLPAMVDVRPAFTPEELEKFASAFKVSAGFYFGADSYSESRRDFRHGAANHRDLRRFRSRPGHGVM